MSGPESGSSSRAGPGMSWLAARLRDRVAAGTGSLFSHGAYPLAGTLTCRGDPGLFGPGSMTWPVVGDAAVFVCGIRRCWFRRPIPRSPRAWPSTHATAKTRSAA